MHRMPVTMRPIPLAIWTQKPLLAAKQLAVVQAHGTPYDEVQRDAPQSTDTNGQLVDIVV